jgi:alpha-tubulin suppressor-like RCC1 family protein
LPSRAIEPSGHGCDNFWGQLGDGTGTERTTPVRAWILDPLAIGSSNSDGSGHSASIHGDGTLWTWGKNVAGALGDGTLATNGRPKPVPNFSLVSRRPVGRGHGR